MRTQHFNIISKDMFEQFASTLNEESTDKSMKRSSGLATKVAIFQLHLIMKSGAGIMTCNCDAIENDILQSP